MKTTIRLTVDVVVNRPVPTAPNLSLDLYAFDAFMRACEGDPSVDFKLVGAKLVEGETQ